MLEEVSMEGCRGEGEIFLFVRGCEDDEGTKSEGFERGHEF